MKVLVTDGANRSALAITRSLGGKGVRVVVTGHEKRSISSSSKFCHKYVQAPDPLNASGNYADHIFDIALKEGIDVIIPTTEQSIYLLNLSRPSLPGNTILACATSDQMERLSNKFNLFKMAERLGVSIPKTIYVNGRAGLPDAAAAIEKYPVVVKPAQSRLLTDNGFLSGGVTYANSRKHLIEIYNRKKILEYPSMIQEKVMGPGTGLFTLYDIDRHLALFSHQRILEKPPSGGVSVISESVPIDPSMSDAADRILSSVAWSGVAMVEFKRDLRDGRAKLMEVNGRFWGSLQLAVSCGVDFPSLFLNYLVGTKPSSKINGYAVGRQLRWILGIMDDFLIVSRKSKKELNLDALTGSKWLSAKPVFKKPLNGISYDVFSPSDMKPFTFELSKYLIDALG